MIVSAEIITMLGGFATLLASGGTFAMFMFRLFVRLEARVDALAREVTNLRGDLAGLSREVSELRGEFRGRFGTQPAAE